VAVAVEVRSRKGRKSRDVFGLRRRIARRQRDGIGKRIDREQAENSSYEMDLVRGKSVAGLRSGRRKSGESGDEFSKKALFIIILDVIKLMRCNTQFIPILMQLIEFVRYKILQNKTLN
jgi:hypothetical protein